jgi:hypothetical protein
MDQDNGSTSLITMTDIYSSDVRTAANGWKERISNV